MTTKQSLPQAPKMQASRLFTGAMKITLASWMIGIGLAMTSLLWLSADQVYAVLVISLGAAGWRFWDCCQGCC